MASQLQYASALTSPPNSWDVFLSFRGIDTRYNFTSHLYSALNCRGIRTFVDDRDPLPGEVTSDESIQAIYESKTYVVVFSKNYASSRWCLDELVEILNCHKKLNRPVIGVYYNIDPSDVRHQTGSFGKAFKKHEARAKPGFFRKAFKKHTISGAASMQEVKNWRLALTEVAGFSEEALCVGRKSKLIGEPISCNLTGYQVGKNVSESDMINEVLDRVLLEIKPITLDVAIFPVGLNSRVNDITSLMSNTGVSTIGIYGMGGVGKTTLAKAAYNQNYRRFQGSCFLENVREVSGTSKGLLSLQQRLINDVLKCKNINIDNVDQGIELIRARICSIKVLVVIDDLDDPRPMEFLEGPFGLGSIIILTTRNEDLLDAIKVEAKYKVNELSDAESSQLFAYHAFRSNKISDAFTELSQEILDRAGGLPLALKVFGSNLLNQAEEGQICIDKLKRVSIDVVEKNLLISYNALKLVDPKLQDIFLDIACFFAGQKKTEVVKIMETCYKFINRNFDILQKRCLLTINNRDELGMHDLLQDMGREIARNNSPDEPGKHSRLWVAKDICDVLTEHKGTEVIEGIIHPFLKSEDTTDNISFTAKTFKRMSKLRFLHLVGVTLTGSFEQTLEDLRWLHWDRCPLECLPSEFYPQKLVILELPRSRIRKLWEPNMVSHVFEKLKTLNMSYSIDLTTTPNFTKLQNLEILNLEGCKSLKEVHISIGSLVRLVFLNLCGCVNLRSLPDSICNLRALEILNIGGCNSVEALPIELGKIESLTKLNATYLSVSKLPDSIGRLSKLLELKLCYNRNLETLPDTICNLRALEVLDLDRCYSLAELPIELGNIESLKELLAMGIAVSKLPDSIGRLSKLLELRLCYNINLETLPDTICNLRALEVLDLDGCYSLAELPIELGNIESLKELHAMGIAVSILPNSIGYLSKLVKLRICLNKHLETLPSTIYNLRSLKILDISGCEKLLFLDQLWKLTRLRELNASGATLLNKLPDIEPSQIALSLKKLDLSTSALTALPSGISQLSNLKHLNLRNCHHLLSIVELAPNLKKLDAQGCWSMKRLPNLHILKLLEYLNLRDCSGLTYIIGLEAVTSIRELHLGGCDASVLEYTLTSRFFQIYSEFGHEIQILVTEFPDWTSQSCNMGSSKCSLGLSSHNFLAMILCFKHWDDSIGLHYSVRNTSNDFIWRGKFCSFNSDSESLMVIVPRSIFLVRYGDNIIELQASAKILGIHLLYEKDLEIIVEDDNTTVSKMKLLESSKS